MYYELWLEIRDRKSAHWRPQKILAKERDSRYRKEDG